MTFAQAIAALQAQLASKYGRPAGGTSTPIARGDAARAVMGAVNAVPAPMFWDWYPASLAVFGYRKPGDVAAGGPRQAAEFLDDDQGTYFWLALGALAQDLDRKSVPFNMSAFADVPASDVEALGFLAQMVNEKLQAAKNQPTWHGVPITNPWGDLDDQAQASVKVPMPPGIAPPDVDPGKAPPLPMPPNPIAPIHEFEQLVVGGLLVWITYEVIKRLD